MRSVSGGLLARIAHGPAAGGRRRDVPAPQPTGPAFGDAGPDLASRRRGGARVDPAPSRMAYRARRAWRRAWVRRAVGRGLPAAIAAALLAVWLGDGEEFRVLGERWAAIRAQVEARPEFAITAARIEGAGPALEPAIEAALPPLPSSTLSLDLGALRDALASMPPVARVDVQATGGVLSVRVAEHRPEALWRAGDGLHALDAEGRMLRTVASRTAHPDLPLIAGEGADRAVAEALALHGVAGPLGPKLRGLVRVGERRWDAVIEDGLRIMLPERDAVAAFERAAALEAAEDLTGRDLTHLDLRDPSRPVLRLGRAATAQMARVLAAERAGEPLEEDQ